MQGLVGRENNVQKYVWDRTTIALHAAHSVLPGSSSHQFAAHFQARLNDQRSCLCCTTCLCGIVAAEERISSQHLGESIPSEESLATFIFSFLKFERAWSSNADKVLLRDKGSKSLLA